MQLKLHLGQMTCHVTNWNIAPFAFPTLYIIALLFLFKLQLLFLNREIPQAISVQSVKKEKKTNTPFNFNTYYRREMKFIPINIDYCQLQFDAIQFFLGISPRGESGPFKY